MEQTNHPAEPCLKSGPKSCEKIINCCLKPLSFGLVCHAIPIPPPLLAVRIWGVTQKYPEFIYKKLCVYFYMFKLQSPSNTLHLMQYTYQDVIFHCSEQFLLVNFDASLCFCHFFCSTSSRWAKCFPLRTFSSGETEKKSLGVRSGE